MLSIPNYTVHAKGNPAPILTTCNRSEAYNLANFETQLTGRLVFVTESVQ